MIDINKILFLDFETTLDKKRGLDIKKLGLRRYLMHPSVDVIMCAYAEGEKEIGISDGREGWPIFTNRIICAHNAKFDGGAAEWKFKTAPNYYIDTPAMARAVLGNKIASVSLASLARYFGLPNKIPINLDCLVTPTKEMIEYCVHDVWLLREIYKILAKEFPDKLYDLIDLNVKSFLRPKLQMNREVLENAIRDEKERRESIISASGVDRKILSSNKQFGELLGSNCPQKTSPRTKQRIPALALGDVQFRQLEKINKPLYDARVAAKSNLLETRCEELLRIYEETGPEFAFDLMFSGAHTHRDSGASGWGGNPQNFTRGSSLRYAIGPMDGYQLIVGDFSQIELRILAWLSGDPLLIRMLSNGEDVYCWFASKFYERPVTKENKEERFFGKTAVLGSGYGMGAKKFQITASLAMMKAGFEEITKEQAQRAIQLYRSSFFKVPQLWEQAQKRLDHMAICKGFLLSIGFLKFGHESVILPSGLKLEYPNLRQEDEEFVYDGFDKGGNKESKKIYGGKLVENICQALAGEILREKILLLRDEGFSTLANVHDEIIATHDDDIDVVGLFKDMMESPVSFWPSLKLEAEVKIGRNWLEAK